MLWYLLEVSHQADDSYEILSLIFVKKKKKKKKKTQKIRMSSVVVVTGIQRPVVQS